MRVYESDAIRNVAIIGHGTSGKTSLTSAMLFSAGAVNRLGRVEDGNTVTDYEEEEIERRISQLVRLPMAQLIGFGGSSLFEQGLDVVGRCGESRRGSEQAAHGCGNEDAVHYSPSPFGYNKW